MSSRWPRRWSERHAATAMNLIASRRPSSNPRHADRVIAPLSHYRTVAIMSRRYRLMTGKARHGVRGLHMRRLFQIVLFVVLGLAAIGVAIFWFLTVPATVSASALPARTPNLNNGKTMFL